VHEHCKPVNIAAASIQAQDINDFFSCGAHDKDIGFYPDPDITFWQTRQVTLQVMGQGFGGQSGG